MPKSSEQLVYAWGPCRLLCFGSRIHTYTASCSLCACIASVTAAFIGWFINGLTHVAIAVLFVSAKSARLYSDFHVTGLVSCFPSQDFSIKVQGTAMSFECTGILWTCPWDRISDLDNLLLFCSSFLVFHDEESLYCYFLFLYSLFVTDKLRLLLW